MLFVTWCAKDVGCFFSCFFNLYCRKHQSSTSLALCKGNHRSPMDSRYEGPVMLKALWWSHQAGILMNHFQTQFWCWSNPILLKLPWMMHILITWLHRPPPPPPPPKKKASNNTRISRITTSQPPTPRHIWRHSLSNHRKLAYLVKSLFR